MDDIFGVVDRYEAGDPRSGTLRDRALNPVLHNCEDAVEHLRFRGWSWAIVDDHSDLVWEELLHAKSNRGGFLIVRVDADEPVEVFVVKALEVGAHHRLEHVVLLPSRDHDRDRIFVLHVPQIHLIDGDFFRSQVEDCVNEIEEQIID